MGYCVLILSFININALEKPVNRTRTGEFLQFNFFSLTLKCQSVLFERSRDPRNTSRLRNYAMMYAWKEGPFLLCFSSVIDFAEHCLILLALCFFNLSIDLLMLFDLFRLFRIVLEFSINLILHLSS